MPGRPHLTATALAAVVLLGGCGFGAVDVKPHAAEPGSEQACAELIDALPDVVSDAVRRDVHPESSTVAVWGDPPVVLRCGISLPPEYRPDAQLLDIEGIAWFPMPGQGGTFFTTTNREPHVEVAVPDDYAPEATVLVDLAEAIASTTTPS